MCIRDRGYVKFNLPNKWDIYLHATPHREDFGKKDRFLSSGCVRVQRPKELAEFILTEMEGKRYPISRIDSVITTKKTRYEVLKNKIPVHIVYLTAFEDTTGTQIHFLTDVSVSYTHLDVYKRQDTLCTKSYLLASRDLLQGAVLPKNADSLWHHSNDSLWQPYTLLSALGKGDADYPSLDSFRSKYKTYTLLRDVMKKYVPLTTDSNYAKAKAAINAGGYTDSVRDAVIVAELPWEATTSDTLSATASMLKSYQYYLGIKDHRKKDSLTQALSLIHI